MRKSRFKYYYLIFAWIYFFTDASYLSKGLILIFAAIYFFVRCYHERNVGKVEE